MNTEYACMPKIETHQYRMPAQPDYFSFDVFNITREEELMLRQFVRLLQRARSDPKLGILTVPLLTKGSPS